MTPSQCSVCHALFLDEHLFMTRFYSVAGLGNEQPPRTTVAALKTSSTIGDCTLCTILWEGLSSCVPNWRSHQDVVLSWSSKRPLQLCGQSSGSDGETIGVEFVSFSGIYYYVLAANPVRNSFPELTVYHFQMENAFQLGRIPFQRMYHFTAKSPAPRLPEILSPLPAPGFPIASALTIIAMRATRNFCRHA